MPSFVRKTILSSDPRSFCPQDSVYFLNRWPGGFSPPATLTREKSKTATTPTRRSIQNTLELAGHSGGDASVCDGDAYATAFPSDVLWKKGIVLVHAPTRVSSPLEPTRTERKKVWDLLCCSPAGREGRAQQVEEEDRQP